MERKSVRQTILYGILAVLAFSALFLATFRGRERSAGQTEAQIVVFGDSIFGLVRDETSVPARLQALSGKSVYNAALGGTSAARMGSGRKIEYVKDSFSLVGLTKAVQAADFGVQKAAWIRESNTEYYPEIIEGLAGVDFSQVEMVLIQQGLNDYHGGVPIENPENPRDETTFLGALRIAVDALRKRNPELRILLVTPTYTWYTGRGVTCEEADEGGGVLADYVAAEIRLAQELEVEILDVYHDLYPHEKWEDWELYTFDGIHPNEAGREKLAERILEAMR